MDVYARIRANPYSDTFTTTTPHTKPESWLSPTQNITILRMLNVSTGSRHVIPRISYYFSQIASTHSGGVRIRRLEVERKFLVTPVAVSYLRSNGGGSRFKKYESLGKQTTHDTYYDQNGLLFSKGVYIRRRNGHWEAKIRTGGDFINSAFTEVDGNNAVKEAIEQNLTVSVDGLSIEEILEPCAEFVTERESWMMDGRFKVDVDTTDFGHSVGEVELTRTFQYANGEEEKEEEKKLEEKMDQEIKAFMQSYPQAFPAGRPLGKLSAYFSRLGYRT
ncbi:CYTH-like domain-containing protein [Halenospora varia]|nr:CYTH-like domain-containing protein [Halenospora varia]